MRWFVESSSIGKTDPADKACIEAPGWQQALQQVRARRGDSGSFASFSVELLDDGYRAIDPTTRTRFVINRAPDDAPLTGQGAEADAASAAAPAASAEPARAKARFSIPDDVVPRAAEPPGSARPAEQPRPAEPAAEPKIAEQPTPGEPTPGGAPTRMLVAHRVASERAREPSAASSLAYREMALIVEQGTSSSEVDALLRARFEQMRRAIGERKGRYVVIAVFDHDFHGSPDKLPIATLSWKDWRSDEPEVRLLGDDAPPPSIMANMGLHGLRRSSEVPAAPPPAVQSAPTPAAVPRAPDSIKRAAVSMAGEDEPTIVKAEAPMPEPSAPAAAPAPAPAPAPAAPAPAPAPAPPAAAAPAPMAIDDVTEVRPSVAPAPPTVRSAPPPAGVSLSAPEVPANGAPPRIDMGPEVEVTVEEEEEDDATATPLMQPAALAAVAPRASDAPAAPLPPTPSVPPRETMTPPPVPKGERLKGDELLSELFESSGDLEFIQDAFDGADFVLTLALEKIPCEVGIVSFFDMNRREFVIVRQRGGQRKALLSSVPEKADLANRAMRGRHAVLASSPSGEIPDNRWAAMGVTPTSIVCAPVLLGGRYLGLLELANPLDEQGFDAADGNALDYLGQQLAEFLGSRAISLDASAVTRPPLRSRMR